MVRIENATNQTQPFISNWVIARQKRRSVKTIVIRVSGGFR